MAEINNADSIRLWLRDCPAINRQKRFGVDYLGDKPTEYSVISIPSPLRTSENILGETRLLDEQEQSFYFVAQLPYGQDIAQNNANVALFQDVLSWICEQNETGNFPEWDGGHIKSIVPSLTPDVYRATASAAAYRTQIKVTYRRN